MSLQIIKDILKLNDRYELHLARLLILIKILTGENRLEIKGITKLVKLDFLLRYPTVLDYALKKEGISKDVQIKSHEKNNVESKMVKFRYGPWDHRYYQYLAILESKGLIEVKKENSTIIITITENGSDVSEKLVNLEEFVHRSKIINDTFGKLSATKLKEMMYELIPELHDMKFGEAINP